MRHPRAWRHAAATALSAAQIEVRGGWSGGGRLTPSVSASFSTEWYVRTAWRTVMGGAREGPAWAVFNAQIARSGQSWQSLLFCSDGQQGMSPDIADMSVIVADGLLAAAGVTTGATDRPMVTKIARKSFRSRRRSIFDHLTATTAWEARAHHKFAIPMGIMSLASPVRHRRCRGSPRRCRTSS